MKVWQPAAGIAGKDRLVQLLETSDQDDLIVADGVDQLGIKELTLVLGRLRSDTNGPRAILTARDPSVVPMARRLASSEAELIDWRMLAQSSGELRAQSARVPGKFRRPFSDLSEGWPVAAQLLSAWAQSAQPEEAEWPYIDIVTASGLAAFIEQEVEPMFTEDELDLLVRASVVETTTVSSRNARETRPPQHAGLSKLAHRFAGLINRQGHVVRIQPAFRVFLLQKFGELAMPQQLEVLQSAALEKAKSGKLGQAAKLLRQANLPNHIEQLVAEHGSLKIWMNYGFAVVQEIVEQCEDKVIDGSPTLSLMKCIVLMKTGRISEAQALFERIEDHPPTESLFDRDREIVRVTLLVYGCGLQRDDDLERFRGIVAQNVGEPSWRSLMSTLLCILNGQRAQFDAAVAALVDARMHARSANSTYNLMFLSLHETAIHLAQGALKKARLSLSDSRKRWRQEFATDLGAETVMSALNASLEYETGQITSARHSVRKSAYRMPDSEAWFDIYAAAYEPMARITADDHGLGAALELLEDQRRRLNAQGLPRVAAHIDNIAMVLAGEHWITGRISKWPAAPLVRFIEDNGSWQEIETYRLACVYQSCAEGRVNDALADLEGAISSSVAKRLYRSCLRFQLAKMSVLDLDGNEELADQAFNEALGLAVRLGATQVFHHHQTSQLTQRLEGVVSNDGHGSTANVAFTRKLLKGRSKSREVFEASLSARELEVITALADGGSDKMLGRALGMTEHGVRFHLKSIYKKLEVHDRVSAIQKARMLGIS